MQQNPSLLSARSPQDARRPGRQRPRPSARPHSYRDFPPLPRYLPRPLAPQDDQLLQKELRRTDDLNTNALLLIRATGIRIGECIDLSLDCLRQLDSDAWALHVPIGKLHNERLVPVDADARRNVARLLELRALASPAQLARSEGFLLPRLGRRDPLYHGLRNALADAGKRAACSSPVTPHQLRHTYASEMIRLGVSLPALMQLLGHKDIRMTLRYVEVTQHDLQREFHAARLQCVSHASLVYTLRSPITPPPPIFPESAKRSPLRAICWRCIAASLPTQRSSARSSASTSDYSLSHRNLIGSNNRKMTKDWPVKWQLLEVKARFIAQVMCGDVSTRRVEDLENAALTFAEIKAIASGNPLVMDYVVAEVMWCSVVQDFRRPLSAYLKRHITSSRPSSFPTNWIRRHYLV